MPCGADPGAGRTGGPGVCGRQSLAAGHRPPVIGRRSSAASDQPVISQ